MNLMRILRKKVLLCLIPASYLAASITEMVLKPEGDSGVSFSDGTTALFQAARQADQFDVFEGLPAQFEGKEFVDNEIRTKGATLLAGDWFYAPSQPMPGEDMASIQSLFGAGLFKPWRGVKFCGGFHGDYAVRFASAGETYLVLFCFSCHEARIMRLAREGPDDQRSAEFRLTTDLSDAGFKELHRILRKYSKQRPATPKPAPKLKVKPPAPPQVPVQL